MRKKNFKIRDAQYDVEAIRREFRDKKGKSAVMRLRRNGFKAEYFPELSEAKTYLLSLIPDGSTVGVGDSHTVYAMDLDDDLEAKNCYAIPNIAALNLHSYHSDSYGYIKAQTREEARQILADYLTSNVFVLGANAITMEARIHFIAAPMDNIKYSDECAAVKSGTCPSCNSPERICNITTIIHRAPIESDFHVILIGEELGF